MRYNHAAAGLAALLSTVAGGTAHAGSVTTIVDPLNPTFTQALGINNAGTIVGYGNGVTFNGFSLTLPSSFTRENVPSQAGGTQVVGIDNAGDSVGFSVDAAGTNNGFYRSAGGTYTTENQPGTVFNQLLGINANGTTAVGYSSATDFTGATGEKAFSLSIASTVYTNIDTLLPSNTNSQATGVNNSGKVVGFYQMASGNFSAFVDVGGVITSFQAPGAVSTLALGVNNQGQIVGDYANAGGMQFGFVDSNGVFQTIDPTGSASTTVNGINGLGQAVGFYTDNNDNVIGFETSVAVPEPATLLVLGSGLLGLIAVRRRGRAVA